MKYLSVLIMSATLLSASFYASAESLIFSRDLSFGIQEDSDVTKLQEFLMDQGVYSGPVTGNFFSLTLKAVKAFQAQEGISPAAGYFGPLTRAKANNILSSSITASDQQAVSETESLPQQQPEPKTTNDITNSLQAQIAILLQQISALQQQINVLQQQNQTKTIELPAVSSANQAPSISDSTYTKLNALVVDEAPHSVMIGQSYITLTTLSISNPNPSEAVRLSEMIVSLSDFAKNISQLRLEIQLPIDDFGDSRRIGVKPESFSSDSACELISLGGGKNYIDCAKFDLSLFQNILFNVPEIAIIPAGKSVRVKIQGDIREYQNGKCGPSCFGTTYVPGEYQNFGKLDSCSGIIEGKNTSVACDVENGLIIPKKINVVIP